MKVFDIHTHIYPDAIAPHAVKAISSLYDDAVIRNDGTLSTLIEREAEAGTTRFAIHSVATTAHQVGSINRFVLASHQANPDITVPFAALHPDTEDLDTLVPQLKAMGFKGIKLHPEFQNFKVDEERALRMFAAAEGVLPILLHCGDRYVDNSAAERIINMKKQFPKLKLVCAHLGGWTCWQEAADKLMGKVDVWVDSSSALYALTPEASVRIIRGYGVKKVIFGSDYPMWYPKEELERFLALPLTDGEKEDILWNNHLELLK
ncbi:MAG: amidohydrolase family protein [Clostridia bacterium]|nr:amidohydrolase family protein [Clostridia bacterium]